MVVTVTRRSTVKLVKSKARIFDWMDAGRAIQTEAIVPATIPKIFRKADGFLARLATHDRPKHHGWYVISAFGAVDSNCRETLEPGYHRVNKKGKITQGLLSAEDAEKLNWKDIIKIDDLAASAIEEARVRNEQRYLFFYINHGNHRRTPTLSTLDASGSLPARMICEKQARTIELYPIETLTILLRNGTEMKVDEAKVLKISVRQ